MRTPLAVEKSITPWAAKHIRQRIEVYRVKNRRIENVVKASKELSFYLRSGNQKRGESHQLSSIDNV